MSNTNEGHGAIADLSVKMGSSMAAIGGGEHTSRIAYHRKQPSSGVTTLLVNMGNPTAAMANAGFRPMSNGNEERHVAHTFMRQLGVLLAQDEDDRKSLSFIEDSELQHHVTDEERTLHPTFQTEDSGTTLHENDSSDRTDDPFHFDLCDDTISIASGLDADAVSRNLLDIAVYSRDQREQLRMRALIDTGSAPNLMRESLAKRTGYPIEEIPQESRALVVANGQEMWVQGFINLTWYFTNHRFSGARSYTIRFLVCSDEVPYDVILGFNFIRNEQLLKWNDTLAMVIVPQDQRRKEEQKRVEAWRKKVDEDKKKQREKDDIARKKAREAKNKKTSG
ncbi:MAG: hypothetical protein M1828_001335 [Chrysothrix sp. TS-e1954]|nr:MAG: hypothetical protein M1828_001335 [Chrysothrix sp. TS-e1954]